MLVLLAGMPNTENQWGRAVRSYGCDVIHTDADPGRVPGHADAAVLIKSNISHRKFDDVKATYKALGKPIFVTYSGFTEIKERFEEWVKKMDPPAPARVKPIPVPREKEKRKFTNTPAIIEVVDEKPKEIEVETKAVVVRKAAKPVVTGTSLSPEQQISLIGKVLASGKPQEDILNLVKEIQAGRLTSEETLTAYAFENSSAGKVLRIVRSSIFDENQEKIIVSLNKEQALAVIQLKDKVEDFATSPL